MTEIRPILLLPLVLAASGCLGGSASTNPHTQPTGRLVGSMVTDGGVSVPTPGGSDISPVKDAPILVTGTTTSGKHVQRGPTTDQHGRFDNPASCWDVQDRKRYLLERHGVCRSGGWQDLPRSARSARGLRPPSAPDERCEAGGTPERVSRAGFPAPSSVSRLRARATARRAPTGSTRRPPRRGRR